MEKYSKLKSFVCKMEIKKAYKKHQKNVSKEFKKTNKEIKKIEDGRKYGAEFALVCYLAGGVFKDAIEDIYEKDYAKIVSHKENYDAFVKAEEKALYVNYNIISKKHCGYDIVDIETGERLDNDGEMNKKTNDNVAIVTTPEEEK